MNYYDIGKGTVMGFNIWGRILTNSLEPWEYFMKLMIKDSFRNIVKDLKVRNIMKEAASA